MMKNSQKQYAAGYESPFLELNLPIASKLHIENADELSALAKDYLWAFKKVTRQYEFRHMMEDRYKALATQETLVDPQNMDEFRSTRQEWEDLLRFYFLESFVGFFEEENIHRLKLSDEMKDILGRLIDRAGRHRDKDSVLEVIFCDLIVVAVVGNLEEKERSEEQIYLDSLTFEDIEKGFAND
jgi:hypothetical protein